MCGIDRFKKFREALLDELSLWTSSRGRRRDSELTLISNRGPLSGWVSRTGIIMTYSILGYVVRRGLIDTYPYQTVLGQSY